MNANNDSAMEFEDIQGLVRFGHGHLPESAFEMLLVRDPGAARDWLREAPVTSAEKLDAPPARVMQVALTAAGLRSLELDPDIIDGFSEEFVGGMAGDANRSRRLGDIGVNEPARWQWGGPDAEPHVLLMLYAGSGALADWQQQLHDDAFSRAFEVIAELPATFTSNREHFGFIDGISQPEIDWPDTVKTGVHERDSYSNVLARGEIVLGYRNEYGLYTDRPLLDPQSCPAAQLLPPAEDTPALRDLGRNGSYLVMRQLSQDVAGFWQFLDSAVEGDSLERERLAAAMVGRERSDGKPLVPSSGLNRFTYDDDPTGKGCPLGAHVRRANPRTGDFPPGVDGFLSRMIRILGFKRRHPHEDLVASSRFHRVLRRGRVYGDELPPEEALAAAPGEGERGLHFVCLGGNISRQFEFVQNAWINSASFAGMRGEADPLLGNREPVAGGIATDRFYQPQSDAPAHCTSGLPRFVQLLGGAYFFLPGLRALRFISGERP